MRFGKERDIELLQHPLNLGNFSKLEERQYLNINKRDKAPRNHAKQVHPKLLPKVPLSNNGASGLLVTIFIDVNSSKASSHIE